MFFVNLNYTLATEEAERIGVDHIARVSTSEHGDVNSCVSQHLTVQHSAIKMLHSRVQLIMQFVKAMKQGAIGLVFKLHAASFNRIEFNEIRPFAGTVPYNGEILREVNSLCHRLPVISTPRFTEEFYTVILIITLVK